MTAPQNPRVTQAHKDEARRIWDAGHDKIAGQAADASWVAEQAHIATLAEYIAHREAAEAPYKAREAALVEALGAIVPFAEDMTESGRQAIANAHRILAALTKEPDA